MSVKVLGDGGSSQAMLQAALSMRKAPASNVQVQGPSDGLFRMISDRDIAKRTIESNEKIAGMRSSTDKDVANIQAKATTDAATIQKDAMLASYKAKADAEIHMRRAGEDDLAARVLTPEQKQASGFGTAQVDQHKVNDFMLAGLHNIRTAMTAAERLAYERMNTPEGAIQRENDLARGMVPEKPSLSGLIRGTRQFLGLDPMNRPEPPEDPSDLLLAPDWTNPKYADKLIKSLPSQGQLYTPGVQKALVGQAIADAGYKAATTTLNTAALAGTMGFIQAQLPLLKTVGQLVAAKQQTSDSIDKMQGQLSAAMTDFAATYQRTGGVLGGLRQTWHTIKTDPAKAAPDTILTQVLGDKFKDYEAIASMDPNSATDPATAAETQFKAMVGASNLGAQRAMVQKAVDDLMVVSKSGNRDFDGLLQNYQYTLGKIDATLPKLTAIGMAHWGQVGSVVGVHDVLHKSTQLQQEQPSGPGKSPISKGAMIDALLGMFAGTGNAPRDAVAMPALAKGNTANPQLITALPSPADSEGSRRMVRGLTNTHPDNVSQKLSPRGPNPKELTSYLQHYLEIAAESPKAFTDAYGKWLDVVEAGRRKAEAKRSKELKDLQDAMKLPPPQNPPTQTQQPQKPQQGQPSKPQSSGGGKQ